MKIYSYSNFHNGRISGSTRFFSILLILLFLTGNMQTVFAAGKPELITLDVNNKTIKYVFGLIEKKTNFIFIYNDGVLDTQKKVSVKASNEAVETVLGKVLAGTGATYKISNRQIIIVSNKEDKKTSSTIQSEGNSTSIQGTVLDDENKPMAGVTIRLKGGKIGAVSNMEGHFSINAAANSTLLFSTVGYQTEEVAINNQTNLKVMMRVDAQLMDEVVVVGYGAVKKSDLTGSVSALKTKDFNKGVVTSPTDLMQGRVTGVNITTNGGEPGAGVSVRVRGANSIRSGQEPLYVVDGVPLDITDVQPSGASTTGVGDAASKNPLNFLNPDDIESIDILKDASATAIYGARGANGVIMVTTKKGKEGRTQVNYSTYAGWSNLPKKIDLLSAAEYTAQRASLGLAADNKVATTDWQDQIFRQAFTQSHNLSFGGGTKNSTYRASFGYMDQEGIIKKSGMEKYNGRLNISTKALNDKLTIEGGLTVARTNDQRAPLGETGGVEGDLLLAALKLNPTYPVYNTDGSFYQLTDQVRNPLAMIELTNDNTQTDRILANISAQLNIWKGLSYKVNLSYDENKASRKVTQDAKLSYMSDKGTAYISNVEQGSQSIENLLYYNFNLGSSHKFNVLAGHSYQKFRIYQYSMSETGFASSEVNNLNDLLLGKNTAVTALSDITLNELQSYFGRINYNLLDKYLFTVNFRADGSTKFGVDNKYGYFPSSAFAWRMGEEKFIKDLNIFNDLKLRIGAGVTGNQEIVSKISSTTMTAITGSSFDGGSTTINGYTLVRTPNPKLKWEKTTQYDAGLDFGFFKGRLSGTLDVFSKITTDLMLYVQTKQPSPTSYQYINSDMNIYNKGVELALNGVMIAKKDFNWSANVNFSKVNNKVDNMTEFLSISTGYASGPGITTAATQRIMNGYSLGTFWGKTFLGFDADGKSMFAKDANGTVIEGKIGSALPDFTYNFGTSLTWKQLDFSVNFNGVYGNEVYNNLGNLLNNMSNFSAGWNVVNSAIDKGEAKNNVLDYSSRYIEDGSYLRLANATIGYSFKMPKATYINKIRAYVSGNNLLTFTKYTGYDPEVNTTRISNSAPAMGIGWTNYPKARTFTVGLSVEL